MSMQESAENSAQVSLPKKITREDLGNAQNSKRAKLLYLGKTFLFLLISAALVSFAAHSLISPNHFTIGGIGGIAILLNAKFGLPQSVIVFCLNSPLVVLSFFFVKKRFALLSSVNIGLQSLFLFLLETFFSDFKIVFGGNGEKIFAAIAAALCIGTAVALAFKIGGSTGGADILAVIIQKKFAATSIAWMLFTINCFIIGSSIFVFYELNPDGSINYGATLLPIMMSAFESYVESKTNESITNGFQSAIEFRIITEKPKQMAEALMRELSRGVTALPAKGMYTGLDRTMLVCVVNRRQVATLRRVMQSVDPESFAVMTSVSQVLGLGFYSPEV